MPENSIFMKCNNMIICTRVVNCIPGESILVVPWLMMQKVVAVSSG